jgi:cellulose synthase/poly-beta-1,6-N-acetylglucosamine synthase-like glycosyltransferase/peptidoglycan/xylan/chitin deacetylase (PgdA/CDA1 family)
MKDSFVFYDPKKTRLKMIFRYGKIFISISILFIYSIIFAYSYIPFIGKGFEDRFDMDNDEIIDEISTRKEDVIDAIGRGPFANIHSIKEKPYLVRNDFKEKNKVILSFDDGPDPVYTPKILEKLKEENVKAVFFVVGEQLLRHPDIAEKIVAEGHEIGVHTFSHTPEDEDIYGKKGAIQKEIDVTQKIIQAQTGYKTKLFRVPNWGAEDTVTLNSLIYSVYALDRGYDVISSTTDSYDWRETNVDNIIKNSFNANKSQIILMHDGGGDRTPTLNSLESVIKNYREAGFEFVTIKDISPNNEPVLVSTSPFEKVTAFITVSLLWLQINFKRIIDMFFYAALGLVLLGISTMISVAFIQLLQKLRFRNLKSYRPGVSIIIPAFNEEHSIEKTVKSALRVKYPKFEVIVINNNSTDHTVEVLRKFKKNPKFKLINEKIQGKFAALNKGIKKSKYSIYIAIDSDTQILPNTLTNIVRPLVDKSVGAVVGNIKVGNVKNMLTVFQAIEYIVGLNLDRRAYDAFRSTSVVPGALGAWRKKVVVQAGGYKNDTLTEDADLTLRVQENGHKVCFATDAVAFTEAPETKKQFITQRLRWTLGMFQVFYKHRFMFFRKKYGVLGMIILPYIGLVQIIMALLAPFVDAMSIFFLYYFTRTVVNSFLAYLALTYIITITAFIIAKEKRVWLLLFIPIARFYYQALWYYVLYKTFFTALKGEYVPWNKLKHVGNVKLPPQKKAFPFGLKPAI